MRVFVLAVFAVAFVRAAWLAYGHAVQSGTPWQVVAWGVLAGVFLTGAGQALRDAVAHWKAQTDERNAGRKP